jgi:hypothetical protein
MVYDRSNAALEMVHALLEAFDNLADAANLVEFHLELVELAQEGPEAGDFCVGVLDRVAGPVVLGVGRRLCLLRELQKPIVSYNTTTL